MKETELELEPDRPPIMEQGKGDITNYLSNYDNKINCTLTNFYQKSNIDYVSSQVCALDTFLNIFLRPSKNGNLTMSKNKK